jgi:hypothetical protein
MLRLQEETGGWGSSRGTFCYPSLTIARKQNSRSTPVSVLTYVKAARCVASLLHPRNYSTGTGGILSGSRKGAASPIVETPDGLRTLAQRAIRLAAAIPSDDGARRRLEFARELEARATALERDGG